MWELLGFARIFLNIFYVFLELHIPITEAPTSRYNTYMNLISLSLQNFRSYSKRTFSFYKNTTIIVGPNAQGKTNLLEALSLLSTGESFRAQKIEEMLKIGEEVGRVKIEIAHDNETKGKRDENTEDKEELEVVITNGTVLNEHAQKRKFLVNGTAKRKSDVVGRFPTVLFRPEDMDLVTGSPSFRRQFLNSVLVQADQEYRNSLDQYEKALKRRNALLDLLREGTTTRAAFTFWDMLMIRHGEMLTKKREEFIEYLNRQTHFPMKFQIVYDPSRISEERLHKYAIAEVEVGYTLVGPHKDDFLITLANGTEKDLAKYGSRGEQRMAILWLKLNELQFLEKSLEEKPLLLLDDVFSELDEKHRKMILDTFSNQQTILTSTRLTVPDTIAETAEIIAL